MKNILSKIKNDKFLNKFGYKISRFQNSKI